MIELRVRAIELSPLDAELYHETAVAMVDFMQPDGTTVVGGESLSPWDVLAKAVERAPDDINHRQRLVDYMLLIEDCRQRLDSAEYSETVTILGEPCDVLRVCEQYLELAPDSAAAYTMLARTMDRQRNAACTRQNKLGARITTISDLPGVRHAIVHGRSVRDPKDVLVFAIDVLHMVDLDLLIALAESLTMEENAAYYLLLKDNVGTLGLATLFGRECSAVDVLGIAMLTHPGNHTVYNALEIAIGRVWNFVEEEIHKGGEDSDQSDDDDSDDDDEDDEENEEEDYTKVTTNPHTLLCYGKDRVEKTRLYITEQVA